MNARLIYTHFMLEIENIYVYLFNYISSIHVYSNKKSIFTYLLVAWD